MGLSLSFNPPGALCIALSLMPERLSVCVSGKGQKYDETFAAHVLPSVETHAVLSRVLIYGHFKKIMLSAKNG